MTSAAPDTALPTSPAALPHGAARLTDWGVIRAQGPEARSFLHGQLTQDIEHLDDEHARLAGYCSAKGRLLATFVTWSRGPDEVLMACSADVLPAALKRLSMFVLRAKCKLVDASADVQLWGLAGDSAGPDDAQVWSRRVSAESGQNHDVIRLPDAVVDGQPVVRHLWAGPAREVTPTLSLDDWRWLEVHSGVARVVAATVEHFVPQMVNLEVVGGVNFKKGCYPGQEVVARSQYRGTLKRRGYLLLGEQALQPGQEVFEASDPGQPAGEVALAGSTADGRHAAWVELKIAAAQGRLHAGAADGPLLRVAVQPYPLPTGID